MEQLDTRTSMTPNSNQSSTGAGASSATQPHRAGPVHNLSSAKRRNAEQNSKLWAMLADISGQVRWPVDGVEQFLPKEDWKVILTAGVRKEARIAAGVNGGFVILGTPTSRMTVGEMSELLDFIQWFGDSRNVVWTNDEEVA